MITIPADADILPPTNDYIFKALLTHPDAERVLIKLISVVIERPVISAQVRNNELPTMDASQKNERLDVNCVIDGGDQVNVEMQAARIDEIMPGHKSFKNKSVYYMADLHTSQKSKGLDYCDLVRTYQITFCTYTVFPDRADFVCRSALRTDKGELVSDQLNMIIIELSKLKKTLKKSEEKLTDLEIWSLFFKHAQDPKYRDLINTLINKEEELSMAATLLMEISQDERVRAHARSRRMFENDMAHNLSIAEKKGEMRGEKRGEKRGIMNAAMGMKAEGIDPYIISKITGLSIDDILNPK